MISGIPPNNAIVADIRNMHRTTFFRLLSALILTLGIALAASRTTISTVDLIVAVAGLCSLYLAFQDRLFDWILGRRSEYTLLFFALLILLSLLFLPLDRTSFGVTTLYMVGLFFLTRFIALQNLRETFLKGYLIGATASSGLGLFFLLILTDTWIGDMVTQGNRLVGFFSDPNVFGAFLVPALLLLAVRLLEIHKHSRGTVCAYAFFFGLCFIALLFTISRGAYIQGITAFAIFLYLEREQLIAYRKILVWAGVIVFSIGLLFVSLSVDPGKFERYGSSIVPRIDNVAFARDILAERDIHTLFIGSGNGSYERLSPNGFSAHNMYVRLIIENGLVGLLTFLGFIGTVLYGATRSVKEKVIRHVLIASVIGILVQGMFIDTLHWRHFWFILGLL